MPFKDSDVLNKQILWHNNFPVADATTFLRNDPISSPDLLRSNALRISLKSTCFDVSGEAKWWRRKLLVFFNLYDLNFVGCRNTFATRSSNSVAWKSSYCDDGGGSCCSAGWSSSCDGGGCDSGCFRRRRGEGRWKMAVAGRTRRPRLESRCAGWSHTNWMYPAGEWWRGDWERDKGKSFYQSGYWFPDTKLNRLCWCLGVCPPGPISPAINASGQVVITIVPSRVVKEISSGAETVAVDHPSWSLRVIEMFSSEGSQIIAVICTFNMLFLPGFGWVSGLWRKPPLNL